MRFSFLLGLAACAAMTSGCFVNPLGDNPLGLPDPSTWTSAGHFEKGLSSDPGNAYAAFAVNQQLTDDDSGKSIVGVYSVDHDGGHFFRITKDLDLSTDSMIVFGPPVVSPDKKKLFFYVSDGFGGGTIAGSYAVNADGTGLTKQSTSFTPVVYGTQKTVTPSILAWIDATTVLLSPFETDGPNGASTVTKLYALDLTTNTTKELPVPSGVVAFGWTFARSSTGDAFAFGASAANEGEMRVVVTTPTGNILHDTTFPKVDGLANFGSFAFGASDSHIMVEGELSDQETFSFYDLDMSSKAVAAATSDATVNDRMGHDSIYEDHILPQPGTGIVHATLFTAKPTDDTPGYRKIYKLVGGAFTRVTTSDDDTDAENNPAFSSDGTVLAYDILSETGSMVPGGVPLGKVKGVYAIENGGAPRLLNEWGERPALLF
jgi:hypothetical protein